MNRRGAALSALLLLVVLVVVPAGAAMAAPLPATIPEPPPPPPVTINDFIPEDRNLSECIGALQRPGCGSESRGGWRQTLIFVAVAAGLVVVFGRIAWSARRGRQSA